MRKATTVFIYGQGDMCHAYSLWVMPHGLLMHTLHKKKIANKNCIVETIIFSQVIFFKYTCMYMNTFVAGYLLFNMRKNTSWHAEINHLN